MLFSSHEFIFYFLPLCIAGVGLGELSFNDVPSLVRYRKEYHPDPAKRDLYDGIATSFSDAYKSLAPFYKRLNSNNGDPKP